MKLCCIFYATLFFDIQKMKVLGEIYPGQTHLQLATLVVVRHEDANLGRKS